MLKIFKSNQLFIDYILSLITLNLTFLILLNSFIYVLILVFFSVVFRQVSKCIYQNMYSKIARWIQNIRLDLEYFIIFSVTASLIYIHKLFAKLLFN